MTEVQAGLCGTCRHVRIVENRRGSRFFLCRRSEHDPGFARYPRLPVVHCRGYEKEPMEDSFYTARARIDKVEGVHRRAHLEAGSTIEFGVHGPIKAHYRIEDRKNLPLPVDYLAAATGA